MPAVSVEEGATWVGKLASGIKLAIPVSRSVLNLHPAADPRNNLHPAADPRNRFLAVPATPSQRVVVFICETTPTRVVRGLGRAFLYLSIYLSIVYILFSSGGQTHRGVISGLHECAILERGTITSRNFCPEIKKIK